MGGGWGWGKGRERGWESVKLHFRKSTGILLVMLRPLRPFSLRLDVQPETHAHIRTLNIHRNY